MWSEWAGLGVGGRGDAGVAVAEDEGAGARETDAERRGVGDECGALAGVEEEAFLSGIDPRGEAVFGYQLRRGLVVDDKGDRDGRSHGRSVSG